NDEDPRVDALYRAPPSQFVEQRNQLVRELGKAGNTEEAARVKALAKPAPSVFAANQAIREAPAAAKALFASAEALRQAQADGSSPAGRQTYQKALEAQRQHLDRLLEAARTALSAAAIEPSAAVLERAENNLRWGSLSGDARPALERGRLQKDVPPPG